MTSSSTTSSTTTIVSVTAAAVNLLNNVTVASSAVTSSDSVHSAPSEPIFLQTKLAQGIAGVFVWAALFVTCTQVSGGGSGDS